LSKHAHWTFEVHVKALSHDEGRLAAVFASSQFKAKSLALALLMTSVAIETFFALRGEEIPRALRLSDREIATRPDLETIRMALEFPEKPSASALRAVGKSKSLLRLADRLIRASPGDKDVLLLVSLMRKSAARRDPQLAEHA
jgi:hypothetical protein